MNVRLRNSVLPKSVRIDRMRDGDIGEIVQWGGDSSALGRLVQRYKDVLVRLGKSSGNSWPDFIKSDQPKGEYRVRILQPGEMIGIE